MREFLEHQKFYSLLEQSKQILLVAHQKPDGDTLGSTSAILNYLWRSGRSARAFCLDPIPSSYAFLSQINQFTYDPAIFEENFDLLCLFDASSLDYAGIAPLVAKMNPRPRLANLDHHLTNERFGDLNLVLPRASSTAEVVYHWCRANEINIDEPMATCLLTGIITDTSNFVNSATNASCLAAAAGLLARGARLSDIINSLWRNKTVPGLQLWGQALANLKENQKLGIASTVVKEIKAREFGLEPSAAIEGLANFLVAVLKAPIIMVLQEKSNGQIKASLRSLTKDVAFLAQRFGGGGHQRAAGFLVTGQIEEEADIWQIQGQSIRPDEIIDITPSQMV